MKIYLLQRKHKLSEESIQAGRKAKNSLYLVYHFGPHQKRAYEWLNIYLYDKPQNLLEKDHNKQTLQLAEKIKAQRVLDSQSAAHGFISNAKSKICFIAFFKTLLDKKESTGNYGNWLSTYRHLMDYTKGRIIPMNSVDELWLENFKTYLLTCTTRKGNSINKLNPNSASSYFNKVRAALRQAFKNRLTKDQPAMRVSCIKGQESHREYLTIEELRKLASLECKVPVMKQMLLFSAMTGLRYSDMKKLKWGDIRFSEQDGYHINYTQKKTKKASNLPIASHILDLLGERKADDEFVFEKFPYSSYYNDVLKEFVRSAGINKHITLHNGRHSYACLLLANGAAITEIKELLAHSKLSTTQIYAKTLDINKIKAANRIPQLMAV